VCGEWSGGLFLGSGFSFRGPEIHPEEVQVCDFGVWRGGDRDNSQRRRESRQDEILMFTWEGDERANL
jgi:hypothetical protein